MSRTSKCECPTSSIRACKREATWCYVKSGLCIKHVCTQHLNSRRWSLLQPWAWEYDRLERR